MTASFSLSPLLRTGVGFDRFNELFETMREGTESAASFPPYNIVKSGDDNYEISMAVAGYSEKELSITAHGDRLTVSGAHQGIESEQRKEYLHRGIAARSFERSFRLADHMKVTGAKLEHGMLQIELQREVPEEQKPRLVPINAEGSGATKSVRGN